LVGVRSGRRPFGLGLVGLQSSHRRRQSPSFDRPSFNQKDFIMNALLKVAALTLSLGMLAGHSARAEDASVAVSKVSVFYGDLDLTRQSGAGAFVSRVKAAAAQACGGRPDIRDLPAMDRFRRCVGDATDGAMLSRPGMVAVAALDGATVQRLASAQ
jgi:UrcA family protein